MIFHFGAAVGVGQSMYEIAHYMGVNTQGTANLLQAILDSGNKLEKLIVASSMSIYGEGRCLCVDCGEVTPKERTQQQLHFKRWEPICPNCGRDLAPILRRLEARGEIRGGRFVSGPFGEQFALPDVIESLRAARRNPFGCKHYPALHRSGSACGAHSLRMPSSFPRQIPAMPCSAS